MRWRSDLPTNVARAPFHFRNGSSINPSSNFEDALLHPSSNVVRTGGYLKNIAAIRIFTLYVHLYLAMDSVPFEML